MVKYDSSGIATTHEVFDEAIRRLNIIDNTGTKAQEYLDYGCQISALCFRSCDETDALYNPVIYNIADRMLETNDAVPYHIIRSWVDNDSGGFDVVDHIMLVFKSKDLWGVEDEMLRYGVAPTVMLYNHMTQTADFGDIDFDVSEDGVLGRLRWSSYSENFWGE